MTTISTVGENDMEDKEIEESDKLGIASVETLTRKYYPEAEEPEKKEDK